MLIIIDMSIFIYYRSFDKVKTQRIKNNHFRSFSDDDIFPEVTAWVESIKISLAYFNPTTL